jgi:hypothetical protein
VARLPRVRMAHFSPSCKHHSQANARKVYEQPRTLFDFIAGAGGAEKARSGYANSERSRVTMSCVIRYAAAHRPETMIVELSTERWWSQPPGCWSASMWSLWTCPQRRAYADPAEPNVAGRCSVRGPGGRSGPALQSGRDSQPRCRRRGPLRTPNEYGAARCRSDRSRSGGCERLDDGWRRALWAPGRCPGADAYLAVREALRCCFRCIASRQGDDVSCGGRSGRVAVATIGDDQAPVIPQLMHGCGPRSGGDHLAAAGWRRVITGRDGRSMGVVMDTWGVRRDAWCGRGPAHHASADRPG